MVDWKKISLFLRRNRRLIISIQWVIVVLYAAMVIIPAFLPLPPEDAHIWVERLAPEA